MWRRYFKLVKLVPGKVIVQGYGTLDFSGDIPVETCKALYETDFEFLQITEEGKRELYGITTPPFGHPSLEGGKLAPVVFNEEPVTNDPVRLGHPGGQEPVTVSRRGRKKKNED